MIYLSHDLDHHTISCRTHDMWAHQVESRTRKFNAGVFTVSFTSVLYLPSALLALFSSRETFSDRSLPLGNHELHLGIRYSPHTWLRSPLLWT